MRKQLPALAGCGLVFSTQFVGGLVKNLLTRVRIINVYHQLYYLFFICLYLYIYCPLLSRRSRQRERLSASKLSICSSVCLSVCLSPKCKKTRFSQKLSNLEIRCPLTTYRKSHMGFSKNLLLDP